MKILYFSSTGNNIYIAQTLNGELLSIPQQIKNREYQIKDQAVGIVFPNYYMTVPDIVGKYLEQVEIEAEYIFTICSYGSIEEGAIRALKKCNKILEQKHEINYSNTVLMVDNYLPAFDMKKEKKIKKEENIKAQIEAIEKDIAKRKQQKISSYLEEEILLEDQQHKEHFQKMIKLELTENKCTQCEICVKVCPNANIKLENKPIIENNCEQCFGCVHHCPNKVIKTSIEQSSERFINPNIKLSQIIEGNNQQIP